MLLRLRSQVPLTLQKCFCPHKKLLALCFQAHHICSLYSGDKLVVAELSFRKSGPQPLMQLLRQGTRPHKVLRKGRDDRSVTRKAMPPGKEQRFSTVEHGVVKSRNGRVMIAFELQDCRRFDIAASFLKHRPQFVLQSHKGTPSRRTFLKKGLCLSKSQSTDVG